MNERLKLEQKKNESVHYEENDTSKEQERRLQMEAILSKKMQD